MKTCNNCKNSTISYCNECMPNEYRSVMLLAKLEEKIKLTKKKIIKGRTLTPKKINIYDTIQNYKKRRLE